MDTENDSITQAEVALKQESVETPEDKSVPSTPSIEELQSRIAEKEKLITELQNQVKGRSKENAKLQQAVNDRLALKQELKDEVANVVREHISALGEVLFAEDEPDIQVPVSKKQQLQNRLKPPEKQPAQLDETQRQQYEESLRYSGRIDALFEDSGVKVEELPEDVVEESKVTWKSGNFKKTYQELKDGINDYLKTKNENAKQKEADAQKERDRKASLVDIPKVNSRGVPTSTSIDALRAKLRSNQSMTDAELKILDDSINERLKEALSKGDL